MSRTAFLGRTESLRSRSTYNLSRSIAPPRLVRIPDQDRLIVPGNAKPLTLVSPSTRISTPFSSVSHLKPVGARFFASSSRDDPPSHEVLRRRKNIRDYVKKHHKDEHKDFGDDVIAMVEKEDREKVRKEKAKDDDKDVKHPDPEDELDVNIHDTIDHQFVFRDMTLEEVIVMKEQEQLEKKLRAEDVPQGAIQKHLDFHRAAGVLPGGLKARLYHVKEDDTVYEAIDVMLKHGIGCVLVVSADSDAPPVVTPEAGKEVEVDHYRGMLTTRDFLHKVVKPAKDIKTTKVGDVSSTPVFADASENCIDTLASMLQTNSRHVLVRKEGKVIGLVAKADLLKKLYKDYKESTGYLLDYVAGGY